MIKREGFPLCATQCIIDNAWQSSNPDDLELITANLVFDNVNVTTAGEVRKERTALPLNPEDPIPWASDTPQAIKDAFTTPEDALRYSLGVLYESDEHQYRLGTKVRPIE